MNQFIQQNSVVIIIAFAVIVLVLIGYKIYKFKKVTELDRAYKKYHENGQVSQEGRSRNIWDYSFFPGLSRLWHQSEWQAAVAMSILVFLLCLYLYTTDDKLFTLLGLNLGIVLGMMIKRK